MLKSLSIKNFRSIEDLSIKKLGQVNLIVGKNNSGKSTVLDALKTYASFADEQVLFEIISSHDEYFILDETDSSLSPFSNLFFGRRFCDNLKIEISESADSEPLIIESQFVEEVQIEDSDSLSRFRVTYNEIKTEDDFNSAQSILRALKIIQGTKEKTIVLDLDRLRRRRRRLNISPNYKFNFKFITTSFIANEELADAWDKIALRDYSKEVLKALQIIEPKIEAISFIDSETYDPSYRPMRQDIRRIPLVKLKGLDIPVPLKSMGDGIVRLFQLALRLFEAKGGLLFIDEFENGLHYSVQEEAWKMIFHLAQKLEVQIFCTTHSWDCIESFSKVAVDNTEIEGFLFRLGVSSIDENKIKTTVTIFNEEDLEILTQSQVEVR